MKRRVSRVLLLRLASPIASREKHPRGSRFPYILKYMEALLKRDDALAVKLTDLRIFPLSAGALLTTVQGWAPDLIVLDSTTRDQPAVLEFAAAVRRGCDPVMVSVGQDATARPAQYLFQGSPIDMVLPGDAEVELLRVIREINHGADLENLKQRYFRQKALMIPALDDLPFPDVTQEELKAYSHIYPIPIHRRLLWGHMISSRGCPYPCMFCTEMIRETTGDAPRFRSAGNVVDEMEHLAGRGANIVIFDDDNFTTSKNHVHDICSEIIRRNLKMPWVAHARVDNITDDLLNLMKDAGCVLLRFGIESGSPRILKLLEKTSREDWAEQAKKVFRSCREIGIGRLALFIIGSPTETQGDIEASVRLAEDLEPDVIQVSFFTFYPDTKAFDRLAKSNNGYDFSKMYHFATPDPELNLSAVDNDTLRRLQKSFYKRILLNPRYLFRHVFKYGLFYLYNPATFHSLAGIGGYLNPAYAEAR